MSPLLLLIYIQVSLLGLDNNMPSSITKIYDEKSGKVIQYDMEKGLDQIDASALAAKKAEEEAKAKAAAEAAATKAALDEVAKAATASTVSTQPQASTSSWTFLPYEQMSPQQKVEATKIAEAYNKTLEQSSIDANKAKYGQNAKFVYPEAATIWNPKTGTKKAVRLDMMTGKILEEDFNALPDDLNPNKGGNWALWTGGMASASAAQAAIASNAADDVKVSAAIVPVQSPAGAKNEGSSTPSYTELNSAASGGYIPTSNTPTTIASTTKSTIAKANTSAPVAATVSQVPAGWIYINDPAALANIPSSYIKKDGVKMYADPSKLKYIGTMAEVAKLPANKRVLLNGRYYQVL
jgi:hypothetical protein